MKRLGPSGLGEFDRSFFAMLFLPTKENTSVCFLLNER
jgi:hypothetical protein